MSTIEVAIAAEGLIKHYGRTAVLRGLTFHAAPATVVCLVGPNGAGKTTAVRILTTLTSPDGGCAAVGGLDVVRDADRVRGLIGLTGQHAAVDEYLTARENLELFGRLHKLSARVARARAGELIDVFELAAIADRPVGTYSGGMCRRVDLAAALVVSPPILFVDEPTTGLDPRSRRTLWELIRERIRAGSTVLLTTQYLEESDHLGDRIYVMDRGRSVADGTPAELKTAIGGERVEVTVSDLAAVGPATGILSRLFGVPPDVDRANCTLSVAVRDRPGVLTETLRALDAVGVAVTDVRLRLPTLDDVFFALTGHSHRTDPAATPEPTGGTQ